MKTWLDYNRLMKLLLEQEREENRWAAHGELPVREKMMLPWALSTHSAILVVAQGHSELLAQQLLCCQGSCVWPWFLWHPCSCIISWADFLPSTPEFSHIYWYFNFYIRVCVRIKTLYLLTSYKKCVKILQKDFKKYFKRTRKTQQNKTRINETLPKNTRVTSQHHSSTPQSIQNTMRNLVFQVKSSRSPKSVYT